MLYGWLFLHGQKGDSFVYKTKRGKGTKFMTVTDAAGLVLFVSIYSASPHEVGLVEQTQQEKFKGLMPQCLIGVRVYDSNSLDEKLREKCVTDHPALRKRIEEKGHARVESRE